MSAAVIDGRAVAASVRRRVAEAVDAFDRRHGRRPGLATVLVGDDPASAVYVRNKHRACEEVGIRSVGNELSDGVAQEEVERLVADLASDDEVDGILVQLPLPAGLDPDRVIDLVPAEKDVDGLTTISAGRLALGRPGLVPCTPAGVMELLGHAGAVLSGAEAVVVGRSSLVGRPVAQLLLQADATVTLTHSRTADLPAVCRRADVLVVAAGRPRLIGPDAVRPGAVVIDVGTNRTDDGLVGDVDFEAVAPGAGAITPVPGGVGPMTIAKLLENTLTAAEARAGAKDRPGASEGRMGTAGRG